MVSDVERVLKKWDFNFQAQEVRGQVGLSRGARNSAGVGNETKITSELNGEAVNQSPSSMWWWVMLAVVIDLWGKI